MCIKSLKSKPVINSVCFWQVELCEYFSSYIVVSHVLTSALNARLKYLIVHSTSIYMSDKQLKYKCKNTTTSFLDPLNNHLGPFLSHLTIRQMLEPKSYLHFYSLSLINYIQSV